MRRVAKAARLATSTPLTTSFTSERGGPMRAYRSRARRSTATTADSEQDLEASDW
jgi:hypothetical protein